MKTWTWAEIEAKVEKEHDIQAEDFITEAELLDYCNDGIDEIEALIHTIYEDYFLSVANLSIVSGTAAYDFPSDIYANKVRKILYDDSNKKYEIKPIKLMEIPDVYDSELHLRYLMLNKTSEGRKIYMYPTPDFTSSTYVSIYYLRNATRLTGDASELDIPEFAQVVMQHMKVKIYEKEGHPNLQMAMAELVRLKDLMVDTLTDITADGNNLIDEDMSHYEEMS